MSTLADYAKQSPSAIVRDQRARYGSDALDEVRYAALLTCADAYDELQALKRSPQGDETSVLRNLMTAWETDDVMGFLLWTAAARRVLGFVEDRENIEVLTANGYDVDAEIAKLSAPPRPARPADQEPM